MSALPVAHYLRDLSNDAAAKTLRSVPGLKIDAETQSDIEKRVDEARTLGMLEGRAAVQAEYDSRLVQHVEALEKKFADERAMWARDQAGRLTALIVSELAAIERRISEQAGAVLGPFVEGEVRRRAVQELTSALKKMLVNGDYAKITITGPEDLAEALRAQLEGKAKTISVIASEQVDVTLTVDETILETRIGDWLEALHGGGQ